MKNLGYVKIIPTDVDFLLEEVKEGLDKLKIIQQIEAAQELECAVERYRTNRTNVLDFFKERLMRNQMKKRRH